METTAPLLEAKGLSKAFPGVRALHAVDLQIQVGELLCVVGENGAGKSTLMEILAGIQQPDSGLLILDGETVTLPGVRAATEAGIALIHQELNLADNLDVAANIYLGREPRRWGFVEAKTARQNSERLLHDLDDHIGAGDMVGDLSIGRRQIVEIAKALSMDARVLIMDEPTSSLSQRETEKLFTIIRELKDLGVGIVFVSHRLAEVGALADRVVVLRDGEVAGELSGKQIGHDQMVRLMIGRDVSSVWKRDTSARGAARMEVRGLCTDAFPRAPNDATIYAGEIIGIAGLVGSGRTEFLETLFGVRPRFSGSVSVDGESLASASIPEAIRLGLALIPEDRKRCGLILEMSVRENLSLAVLRDDARGAFIDHRRERKRGDELTEKLGIRTPNREHAVQLLSGGNQQKTVLGKWLATNPRVLLLDEPTRGIDVGAKEEIYRIMGDLAEDGASIVFVSSELEEVLSMSDRVLVMHEGVIAGEVAGDDINEENIMRLATGAGESAQAGNT